MAITDELREYTEEQIKWLDMTKVHYRKLFAIADRIDSECERQLEALYHDMSDAEYIELPKDADGKPIHIGDVLAPPADCDDYVPLQVMSLTYDGYEKEWFFDGEAGGFCGLVGQHMDVAGWTHYRKQPTVEDVLRQFLGECESAQNLGYDEVPQEVFAEYAKRLKLVGEGDE